MANWLNEIRSESTPDDEIAIYCLSNMYLRHVYVKTNKLFWTTVRHTWDDDEASVRSKCELFLMYFGTGKYGEYIPLVTQDHNVLTLDDLSVNRSKTTPTTTATMPTKGKKTKSTKAVGPKNPNSNRGAKSGRKNSKQSMEQSQPKYEETCYKK